MYPECSKWWLFSPSFMPICGKLGLYTCTWIRYIMVVGTYIVPTTTDQCGHMPGVCVFTFLVLFLLFLCFLGRFDAVSIGCSDQLLGTLAGEGSHQINTHLVVRGAGSGRVRALINICICVCVCVCVCVYGWWVCSILKLSSNWEPYSILFKRQNARRQLIDTSPTHSPTHTSTLTHADVVLHPVATLTLITALGPRSRAAQLTRDMTRCVCVCVCGVCVWVCITQVLGTLSTSTFPKIEYFEWPQNESFNCENAQS